MHWLLSALVPVETEVWFMGNRLRDRFQGGASDDRGEVTLSHLIWAAIAITLAGLATLAVSRAVESRASRIR